MCVDHSVRHVISAVIDPVSDDVLCGVRVAQVVERYTGVLLGSGSLPHVSRSGFCSIERQLSGRNSSLAIFSQIIAEKVFKLQSLSSHRTLDRRYCLYHKTRPAEYPETLTLPPHSFKSVLSQLVMDPDRYIKIKHFQRQYIIKPTINML